jgi:hypothetical protein
MRVAICQVDGKWPNLALAKIVAAHRGLGDTVEWFMPLDSYDLVYASKIFLDTPDNPYLPPDVVLGGTGYRSTAVLPGWIEETLPDFSLWPTWHKSMGFTTRGCVRRCPFCVVPAKEGPLRVVANLLDIWDGRSREVVLLDGNVTAAPIDHFRGISDTARWNDITIDFCQGFDVRLWTDEHQEIATHTPFARRVHFAFDLLAVEPDVRRVVSMWTGSGMGADRLMFYVLVGYDTTPAEDAYRIDLLTSLGVNPFVMPFDRHEPYQRRLARWCNSVVARKTCTFAEYVA